MVQGFAFVQKIVTWVKICTEAKSMSVVQSPEPSTGTVRSQIWMSPLFDFANRSCLCVEHDKPFFVSHSSSLTNISQDATKSFQATLFFFFFSFWRLRLWYGMKVWSEQQECDEFVCSVCVTMVASHHRCQKLGALKTCLSAARRLSIN